MKWHKTSVLFESGDPETAAALITDIFLEFGLKGVIVESPDVEPGLDWAENAAAGPGRHAVTGFFPENHQKKNRKSLLKDRLSGLSPSVLDTFRITCSDVDEEDWSESWKRHFHPVRVTDRIVVRPSWRAYDPGDDEIVIDLDPGMAFGTGTHPTTALCIRMVAALLKKNQSFLDIGTGSGILMIAAAKTGAGKLMGIDCDPVAVAIARKNLLRNHVSESAFTLVEGDLAERADRRFDVIAANIVAETICGLIPDIPPILSENGIFIASGIIIEKEEMVIEKLADCGFTIIRRRYCDGWCAIAASRQ